MKRKLLAFLSILACMSIFAACGKSSSNESSSGNDSGSSHVHSYGTWKGDETNHWKECECGEAEGAPVAHTFDIAKSDDEQHWTECACGWSSEKENHAFDNLKYDADKHWYECECGKVTGEEAHKGGGASCSGAAVCDVCEQPYGKEGEHIYNVVNKDDTYHWNECACGEIDASSKVAHDYSEAKKDETNHWNECACGVIDESSKVAHEYTIENKDETSHWKECTCGEKTDVAEHDYTVVKKDEANHWKECTCGAKSDEEAHQAAADAEWKANAENHWKECECGAEVEKAEHSGEYAYTDNGDTHTKSNVCCGSEVETTAHNYNLWDKTGASYDYMACECGAKDTAKYFDKSVSLINQDILLTDSASALNVSGISEYASIVSIKCGEYDLGTNPSALVISDEFEADTKNHGKQTIIITVKGADEAEHAVSVPVTLITKTIATVADFKSIQPTSEVKGVWGYYVLTADIADNSLASSSYVGDWEETTGFFATLDGAGHTISAAANGAGGLFGILRNATIKNLTVKDNWRSAWASGGAALLAKACFNSTLDNVTFTYVAGNTSPLLGNGFGWLCCAEFSGNLVKNVTVNDTQGYGSLFGYKFYNNTFDNVTINGTYTEMGHTAPVLDDEGNEIEAAKSVTYEEVTKAEVVEIEKVTLETRQDFILEGAVSTLDLGKYNDATILAIKTSTGYELNGLSSDVATTSFKAAKEFHGEQNIIVTARTADGKLLEIIVPVTVITKEISTMADLQTAVKHMGANLYGYYILANDVAYTEEGYVGKNASYAWNAGTGFKGTLDGRNHKITMAGNNAQHGIFGTLHGATVKNVHIVNAWYNGWGAATLGYTAYNTTFENVTITIYGNTISDTSSSVGAVVGAETGGCTWKDVTINVDQAQGTLFKTINKDNKMDTFENVTVNGTITQFSDKGTPNGVTIVATGA
ncbi:MAG: hypothetical protein J6K86_03070 [Clostridia bacterium]|nr:hypothetical protein [Clostridia bacterium]